MSFRHPVSIIKELRRQCALLPSSVSTAPLPFLCPRYLSSLPARKQSTTPVSTRATSATRNPGPATAGHQVEPGLLSKDGRDSDRHHGVYNDATSGQDSAAGSEPLSSGESIIRTYQHDKKMRLRFIAGNYTTPQTAIADQRETRRRKQVRAYYLQKYRSQRYKTRQLNWRPMTDLLLQMKPSKEAHKGQKMVLREQSVHKFTGSNKENMWIYPIGTGCEVFVPSRSGQTSEQRTVRYNGSSWAMKLLEEELEKLEETVSPSTSVDLESKCQSEPNNAWDRTIDSVKAPEEWSVRLFYDYITQLVSFRVSQIARVGDLGMPTTSSQSETHNQKVAARLVDCFQANASAPFASVAALNNALDFASRHTELSVTAESLLLLAKQLGLRPNVNTYNILLAWAIKNNDEQRAKDILSEMIDAKVPPNGLTWAAVFSAARNFLERYEILDLAAPTLFQQEPEAIKSIAQQMIAAEVGASIRNKEQLEKLMEDLKRRFGSAWITEQTFKQIIQACTHHRARQLAVDVVKSVISQSPTLSGSMIDAFIVHCRRNTSLRDVIMLLHTCVEKGVYRHDTKILWAIFDIAWSGRYYNACRLIWQIAASRGTISRDMLRVVLSSLQKNTVKDDTPSQIWRSLAGKLVAGTDLSSHNFAQRFPILSQQHPANSPMIWLLKYAEDDGARAEQRELAFLLLKRDLKARRRFEPLDLAQNLPLLDKAYALDKQWRLSNHVGSVPKEQLLKDVMEVPLVRRVGPHDFDRDTKIPNKGHRIHETDNVMEMLLSVANPAELSTPTSKVPASKSRQRLHQIQHRSLVAEEPNNHQILPESKSLQDQTFRLDRRPQGSAPKPQSRQAKRTQNLTEMKATSRPHQPIQARQSVEHFASTTEAKPSPSDRRNSAERDMIGKMLSDPKIPPDLARTLQMLEARA